MNHSLSTGAVGRSRPCYTRSARRRPDSARRIAGAGRRRYAKLRGMRPLPSLLLRGYSVDSSLMNLWSRQFASQPAVFIPDGPEVSYGQLQQQIEAVTASLREGGVQAGEPIAI